MYLRNLYDCAALFADENFAKLFDELMQYVYNRLDNLPCKNDVVDEYSVVEQYK